MGPGPCRSATSQAHRPNLPTGWPREQIRGALFLLIVLPHRPDFCVTLPPASGFIPMKKTISVTINGTLHSHEVEPRLLLIHYIREVVGLTGPHVGCETSICGACTVHLDGKAIKACSLFAVQADGRNILTIEGLAEDGAL